MKKKLILFAGFLLPVCYSFCQYDLSQIKPLTIGDTLPDIVIENVSNYSRSSFKFSDAKDKKIILLDFWSTKCGSCVGAFPKLTAFSEKYKDDLQILLVNPAKSKEDNEFVDAFFKKKEKKEGLKVTLPYTVGDLQLEKYFPFVTFPHVVWLNQDRKVIAITSTLEATEANITAMMRNETINIRHKEDVENFRRDQPIFIDGNGKPRDAILYKSTVAGFVEGVGFKNGLLQFNTNGISRYSVLNYFLEYIYIDAFRAAAYYPHSIIFETKKKHLFERGGEGNEYLNLYTYELLANVNSEEELLKDVQEELGRYFKLTMVKENRLREVYVLTRDRSAKKGDTLQDFKNLQKYSGLELTIMLGIVCKARVIDETETGTSVYLPMGLSNEESLEKVMETLRKQGYKLTKQKMKVDVMVYKDL